MSEISAIRKHLGKAAKRQPEHARTFAVLSKQLMNFENGTAAEQAALRPVIRDSMKRIEQAGYGR